MKPKAVVVIGPGRRQAIHTPMPAPKLKPEQVSAEAKRARRRARAGGSSS